MPKLHFLAATLEPGQKRPQLGAFFLRDFLHDPLEFSEAYTV